MSCYSAGDGAGHEAVAAEVCPGEKLLRGQWWWWPSVQPPPPPLPGTHGPLCHQHHQVRAQPPFLYNIHQSNLHLLPYLALNGPLCHQHHQVRAQPPFPYSRMRRVCGWVGWGGGGGAAASPVGQNIGCQ